MEKRFIRFICNTNAHPRGKKIKALNIITKVYDDEDNFLYVKKPYIYALENQIEIDIDMIVDGEQIDYKKYLPLYHFKVDKGKIVQKTDSEIQTIEAEIAESKRQKEIERQQKEQEKQNNENIIIDDTKTDTEKLNALINLYKGN